MKKIFVISLVVVMLSVSVVPALAAGSPPVDRGSTSGTCTRNSTGISLQPQAYLGTGKQAGFGVRNPYALSGTISAIDANTKTIMVTVACGNLLATPNISNSVTIQTTDNTRFLLRNENGNAIPITFADLAIGQTVSSHGSLVDGTWIASRVTRGALLNCVQ